MTLILLSLLACTPEPEDTADTGDTSDPVTCADRALDECTSDGLCAGIMARIPQDDGEGGVCLDWTLDSEIKGCMDADTGCGDAETWGAPSAGAECLWFPSTCLPDGWVDCGWIDMAECPADTECADYSPSECGDHSECATITARTLHTDTDDDWCVDFSEDPVAVGCMDGDMGCDEALHLASDPEGTTWWFSNGCIPEGWTMEQWVEVGECAP